MKWFIFFPRMPKFVVSLSFFVYNSVTFLLYKILVARVPIKVASLDFASARVFSFSVVPFIQLFVDAVMKFTTCFDFLILFKHYIIPIF